MSFLNRILDIIRDSKLLIPIWWLLQITTLFFLTRSLLVLNKPEIMPAAGALSTIFWYLLYTRQKGAHEDTAFQCHLTIVETMVRQDIFNSNHGDYNLDGELAKRDYEIGKINARIDKFDERLRSRENARDSSPFQFGPSSIRPSARIVVPRVPLNFSRQKINQDSYHDSITNLLKVVRDSKEMSARFSLLEGVAIFYSAVITVFGNDVVIWWNAQ